MSALPPQAVLHELLDYDQASGLLTWKRRSQSYFSSDSQCRRWNTRYAGMPALASDKEGYRHGILLGNTVSAHRVIWKWMTGLDPKIIDHINGITSDNRWANLRSTDELGNAHNCALQANNTSGCAGVSYAKRQRRWRAWIRVDGKSSHLGYFKSITDAVRVRKAAEAELGYHPNHGRARQ